MIFAGVAISIFSVVAAVLNSTSRLMFTLSREGLMPPAFSRTGKRTLTPVVGLGVMTAINVVTAAILLLINKSNLTVYGYFSSFAGYGAILAYLVVSLAALGYLYKLGKLRPIPVVVGLIAAACAGLCFLREPGARSSRAIRLADLQLLRDRCHRGARLCRARGETVAGAWPGWAQA